MGDLVLCRIFHYLLNVIVLTFSTSENLSSSPSKRTASQNSLQPKSFVWVSNGKYSCHCGGSAGWSHWLQACLGVQSPKQVTWWLRHGLMMHILCLAHSLWHSALSQSHCCMLAGSCMCTSTACLFGEKPKVFAITQLPGQRSDFHCDALVCILLL